MPNESYEPEFTVEDVLDDRVRIQADARVALVAFRRSKPWRGALAERSEKFRTLHAALAAAYGLDATLRLPGEESPDNRGNGAYLPGRNAIVLSGKLSVVTYLHCLAKARGLTHREACRWSINVFRKLFPVSYSRCRADGYSLVRD